MMGMSDTLINEMRASYMALLAKPGQVFVLTSRWRRWRKTEQWAIAHRDPDSQYARFLTPTGERAKDIGDYRRANDPDLWPDEVCAAVARLMLSE